MDEKQITELVDKRVAQIMERHQTLAVINAAFDARITDICVELLSVYRNHLHLPHFERSDIEEITLEVVEKNYDLKRKTL